MSWENVDNKHKKKLDKKDVSCEENYEIDYLVKIIMEEYDWINEIDIRKAIIISLLKVETPRQRDEFMKCLKENLGVV